MRRNKISNKAFKSRGNPRLNRQVVKTTPKVDTLTTRLKAIMNSKLPDKVKNRRLKQVIRQYNSEVHTKAKTITALGTAVAENTIAPILGASNVTQSIIEDNNKSKNNNSNGDVISDLNSLINSQEGTPR